MLESEGDGHVHCHQTVSSADVTGFSDEAPNLADLPFLLSLFGPIAVDVVIVLRCCSLQFRDCGMEILLARLALLAPFCVTGLGAEPQNWNSFDFMKYMYNLRSLSSLHDAVEVRGNFEAQWQRGRATARK